MKFLNSKKATFVLFGLIGVTLLALLLIMGVPSPTNKEQVTTEEHTSTKEEEKENVTDHTTEEETTNPDGAEANEETEETVNSNETEDDTSETIDETTKPSEEKDDETNSNETTSTEVEEQEKGFKVIVSEDTVIANLNSNSVKSTTMKNQTNSYSRLHPINTDFGFNFQIIEANNKRFVLDIKNTSSSPFTITTNNVYFSITDMANNDISGSAIEGGSVTISPNEIKRVVATGTHAGCNTLQVKINGSNVIIESSSLTQKITDTTPQSDFQPTENLLEVYKSGTIYGDGKLKVATDGIVLLDNNDFIGYPNLNELGNESGYGLLHVSIANTSNSPVNIERIVTNHALIDTDKGIYEELLWAEVSNKTLNAISNSKFNPLPTKIEANSIVSGYIPVIITQSNYSDKVSIKFKELDAGYSTISFLEPKSFKQISQ